MKKKIALIILFFISFLINVLLSFVIITYVAEKDEDEETYLSHLKSYSIFTETFGTVSGEYTEHNIRLGSITLVHDAETKITFSSADNKDKSSSAGDAGEGANINKSYNSE